MAKVKMTPSEAIVETLLAEGVEHVTGILGSAFMDLLDLFPTAGIRFIPVRHEQSAGHMEDAFCRVTGKCGVSSDRMAQGSLTWLLLLLLPTLLIPRWLLFVRLPVRQL